MWFSNKVASCMSCILSLRTKSREATRAAKASAAQIAELEAKVQKLEKKSSAQAKLSRPTLTNEKSARPRGRKPAVKAEPDVPTQPVEPIPADSATPGD
jgi:hypothetical protein